MRKKSDIVSTIILTIILLVGLAVMLYPSFSNWWNSRVQSRAVAGYDEIVANMDDDETERLIKQAHDYNEKLSRVYAPLVNADEVAGYDDILNISGTGIMGYITIPFIRVELPIYHGTSEEVLNIAAGHLKGTSFPVGGANTHAVISAHRGLPSAKLFTDLDRLVVGDTFTINVLGEVYTYEIEEILKVLPEQVEALDIDLYSLRRKYAPSVVAFAPYRNESPVQRQGYGRRRTGRPDACSTGNSLAVSDNADSFLGNDRQKKSPNFRAECI